jgi:hypothetical protein
LLTAAASAGVLALPIGACRIGHLRPSLSVKGFVDHMHESSQRRETQVEGRHIGGLMPSFSAVSCLSSFIDAGFIRKLVCKAQLICSKAIE